MARAPTVYHQIAIGDGIAFPPILGSAGRCDEGDEAVRSTLTIEWVVKRLG